MWKMLYVRYTPMYKVHAMMRHVAEVYAADIVGTMPKTASKAAVFCRLPTDRQLLLVIWGGRF